MRTIDARPVAHRWAIRTSPAPQPHATATQIQSRSQPTQQDQLLQQIVSPGPCRHIASRTIPTIGPLVVPVAHPSISPASWRSATPPSPQPSTIGSSLRSRSSGRPTPVRPVVRQWFHPRCQPKAMSNCAAPPQAHPAPPLPAPPPPHSCPAAMQAPPFRCPRPATFPIWIRVRARVRASRQFRRAPVARIFVPPPAALHPPVPPP